MSELTSATAAEQRTRCEIYSRVVGYIRPVNQWNEGKQAEYADRVEFSANSCGCE